MNINGKVVGFTAEEISYDNTTSGLAADEVQTAIDLLNTSGGGYVQGPSGLVTDGAVALFDGTTGKLIKESGDSLVITTNGISRTTCGISSGDGGDYTTFYGHSAGATNTGGKNVFIGDRAGYGSTATVNGANNIAIGSTAGFSISLGDDNVFMGDTAGYYVTEGVRNVAIGKSAGQDITTGNYNTFIGNNADTSVGEGDAEHRIAIGRSATCDTDNHCVFGSASASTSVFCIKPGVTSICDLGSTTLKFKDIYISGVINSPFNIQVACSNESTPLTVSATAKTTFRIPQDFTLSSVRGSLTTVQTSGVLLTINILKNGTTIFGTKLTFDNGSTTTVGATTDPTYATTTFTSDDEIKIYVDIVGSSADAAGLKITFLGRYS